MKTTQETLNDLFDTLCDSLKTKISSSECTASDLNVARMFLHAQGITCIAKKGSPLGKLVEALPFTTDADMDSDETPHPTRPN